MSDLNLALIGNCSIGVLVNARGDIVWGCFPDFDSDALFCELLQCGGGEDKAGIWAIELCDLTRTEQAYLDDTPILVTRLYDRFGGIVELRDFAPRHEHYGRMFCPMMLVRRVRRVAGNPRLRIRLRPAANWGAERAGLTWGSNHVRYITPEVVLRLTTDASITAVLQEDPFFLDGEITLLLGPDEMLTAAVSEEGRRLEHETTTYWRRWVRSLAIPYEWQEAVIRAAITLKLNAVEDTGAIVAALTTSVPEAAYSSRNWDYRYCWLRDAYFTVNALNRLSTTQTMEQYLDYIVNIAASAEDGRLQPLYRIDGHPVVGGETVTALPGYRDMGPVRIGNLAATQTQNDVYGAVVLSASHLFFDRRLRRPGLQDLFQRLETLGETARQVFTEPDAGLWELRGSARVHTFSSVMCWCACDRLARIAQQLGRPERSMYWAEQARGMREKILTSAWNEKGAFLATSFGGSSVDASLLLLPELHFITADDPYFAGTLRAIERDLKHGGYIFRYREEDDFGMPENAFLICTFWYIDALVACGRRDEARGLFETMLERRNPHGLYAEHLDPTTGELWGNFVQTYSMVGLINSAVKLSQSWEAAF
ncbi:MAG TPA: glycoside hydrolase family 15 protein [Hyphomicrobiales bacterium]|nr:glycoside hydrolase family 15 protein [Hyphomicrobiales bacterium]